LTRASEPAPLVQLLRPIALDTAVLSTWAYRWARSDATALRLVDRLLQSNVRPVVTIHHLMELVGHSSDAVVEGRVRFVRRLEQLFWVRMRDSRQIGGILDLYALEIRARLRDRNAGFGELLSSVRPDVLAFGDSEELSMRMEEPLFIANARRRIQRRREVASLTRAQISTPELLKRPVTPQHHHAPLPTILARFDQEQRHLESQLTSVGDPDLATPASVASRFFDGLREHAVAASADGTASLDRLLTHLGVDAADVASPVQPEALADKYMWKRQCEVLAQIADVSPDAVERLRRTELPSIWLCDELSIARKGVQRAEGGDSDDAALACLSFHVPLTSVDKRTADAVRQVRIRRPELDAQMGQVVKIPTLEALEAAIENTPA
jgi:hypothetical protein